MLLCYQEDEQCDVFIDLNHLTELTTVVVADSSVSFGANVKITDAITALQSSEHEVWNGIAHHMKQIGSYGVRNQGSLAGNLMMKHYHTDFPSDVFVCLETAGAQLEVVDHSGSVETVELTALLTMNMNKKLILKIKINLDDQKETLSARNKGLHYLWSNNISSSASESGEWVYKSFKVMPRSGNAHAYVNAGFMALFDKTNSKILNRPRIVFGGISSSFIHASVTEMFLSQREVTHDVFLEALGLLAEELILDDEPVLSSPIYRKQLAMGLFYKVMF